MRLSNRAILELRQALTALDGHPVPVVTESGKTQFYTKPYAFTGSIRFRIGRMLKTVSDLADIVDKARQAIVKQYAVNERVPPEKAEAYTGEIESLFAVENEVPLDKLAEADLKLDENELPVSVISALSYIM